MNFDTIIDQRSRTLLPAIQETLSSFGYESRDFSYEKVRTFLQSFQERASHDGFFKLNPASLSEFSTKEIDEKLHRIGFTKEHMPSQDILNQVSAVIIPQCQLPSEYYNIQMIRKLTARKNDCFNSHGWHGRYYRIIHAGLNARPYHKGTLPKLLQSEIKPCYKQILEKGIDHLGAARSQMYGFANLGNSYGRAIEYWHIYLAQGQKTHDGFSNFALSLKEDILAGRKVMVISTSGCQHYMTLINVIHETYPQIPLKQIVKQVTYMSPELDPRVEACYSINKTPEAQAQQNTTAKLISFARTIINAMDISEKMEIKKKQLLISDRCRERLFYTAALVLLCTSVCVRVLGRE
ncbi:hypothetical protein SCG7109_AL_00110 [Chlamydiales bacterium SCGC AG-110-M15]|nr:hypothetical protein SCG7109_AL_00110 [Chlamydiales bacterium SCGC AG-110-M15]